MAHRPQHARLEHATRDSESLLTTFHAGDSDAIDRVHQHLPQVKNLSRDEVRDFSLTLLQAQTVIARGYGMKSWGELRLAIKLEQRDFGAALERFKQLIYARDAEKFDELLRAHPELRDTLDDPHFDFGLTAVIIARNSLELVDVLLLAYCAVGDAANAQRLAAEHPKIVSQLPDADQRQLIVAAGCGDIEAVRVMVSLGFKLHIRDDDAMTPLHWAAFHGDDKVIELLLAADDEPPLTWLNGYGGTPMTTCFYGSQHTWRTGGDHAASLQLLVDAGSELKAEWLPTGNDAFDEIIHNSLT